MKKALIFVLVALVAVAFIAAPAFAAKKKAATTVKLGGSYEVTGYYLSNPGASANAGDAVPDAFLDMIFYLTIDFTVAKNVGIKTQFRGLDKIWGANYTNDGDGRNDVQQTWARIWWVSPIGYWLIGHYQSSTGTLVGMGIGQSKVGADRFWHDSESTKDRVILIKSFGNVGTMILFQKIYEQDAFGGVTDADYDFWDFMISYKWKTGFIELTDYYFPNRITESGDTRTTTHKPGVVVSQRFGPLFVGGEIRYVTGITTYDHDTIDSRSGEDTRRRESLAWEFHIEYADGPIRAGFMWGHLGGDPDSADDLDTGSESVGDSFKALYAAFGEYDGILYKYSSATANLGLNVYMLWVEFNAMENLWLQAAVGWMAFSHSPMDGVSRNIGYEIDFGLAYELARNFVLQIHVGAFMPQAYFSDREVDSGSERSILAESISGYGTHYHADMKLILEFK